MKSIISLFLLFSMSLIGMEGLQPNQIREAKFVARSARFLERLAYFNTAQECEDNMTTESEAEIDFAKGRISQQEWIEWKARRTQERMRHDQQIKMRKKNVRVEALLKKITLNREKRSLYCKLYSTNYKNMPAEQALQALGYDADSE